MPAEFADSAVSYISRVLDNPNTAVLLEGSIWPSDGRVTSFMLRQVRPVHV